MPKNKSIKKRVSKRANRKIRGKSRKQKSMRNKKRMGGAIVCNNNFEEYMINKYGEAFYKVVMNSPDQGSKTAYMNEFEAACKKPKFMN